MIIKTIVNIINSLFSSKKEIKKEVIKVSKKEGHRIPKQYDIKYIDYSNNNDNEYLERQQKYKELSKNKINMCFIPKAQNSINIRSMLEYVYNDLPKKGTKPRFYLWAKSRQIMENLNNGCCSICGESGKDQGKNHNTELHEVWDFHKDKKYKKGIAKLKYLLVLCPNCHKTCHINMYKNDEQVYEELKIRYCILNNYFKDDKPDFDKFEDDLLFMEKVKEQDKDYIYDIDLTLFYKKFHRSLEKDFKQDFFKYKNDRVYFEITEDFKDFVNAEFKNINIEDGE